MPITQRLLRREIRYESAKEEETNILHQLGYYDKRTEFFSHLHNHQGWMQKTVAHHLNLNSSDLCHVSDIEDWLHGSFNVCVPVTIRPKGIKVILRLPLPYRVGEDFRPGNGDEKVRCEAGSYAWLQANCPEVPIPELYGFALSTVHLPGKPAAPTSVVSFYSASGLRISQTPVPRIGSFIIDLGDCVFQLASLAGMRTVSKSIFQKGLRRGPFVFSLTDLHQSNIFVDADWNVKCLVDLEWACALLVEMVRPPYWLTNVGVDELVASGYDPVRTEFMDALAVEEEAVAVTAGHSSNSPPLLSDIMQKSWATGTFWYTLALSSPSGLFMILKQHVRPRFCKDQVEEFNTVMPFLWDWDIGRIAAEKLSDKKEYDRHLQQAFEAESQA